MISFLIFLGHVCRPSSSIKLCNFCCATQNASQVVVGCSLRTLFGLDGQFKGMFAWLAIALNKLKLYIKTNLVIDSCHLESTECMQAVINNFYIVYIVEKSADLIWWTSTTLKTDGLSWLQDSITYIILGSNMCMYVHCA